MSSLGNKILLTFFLLRWRSSLWKLLWRELLVYTVLFLIVSMVYRSYFSISKYTKSFSKISVVNNMGMQLGFREELHKVENMSALTVFQCSTN